MFSRAQFIKHQWGRVPGSPLVSDLPAEQLQWLRDEPGLLDHLIELSRAIEDNAREDRVRFIAMRDGSTRHCTTCGDPFVALRSDARYCSPRCRQKAYRQRA